MLVKHVQIFMSGLSKVSICSQFSRVNMTEKFHLILSYNYKKVGVYTSKMALNGQEQHRQPFFCPKGKKPIAEDLSPAQDLEIGSHSGPYLLYLLYCTALYCTALHYKKKTQLWSVLYCTALTELQLFYILILGRTCLVVLVDKHPILYIASLFCYIPL